MQWLILQQEKPDDFVISTGKQISVRKFIDLTARELGWGNIIWEGNEINEIGKRADNGKIVIKVDPRYFRPTEVQTLLGDSSKARDILGWSSKITVEELVSEMVANDKKDAEKESLLLKKGMI